MMPESGARFFRLAALVRLVTWIMPAHRKGWAQAMLGELPCIDTRGAAIRWLIGGMLFAIRERSSYLLENARMNNRIFKTALLLLAVAVGGAAGVYGIQKPYQQERIKIVFQRMLDAHRA